MDIQEKINEYLDGKKIIEGYQRPVNEEIYELITDFLIAFKKHKEELLDSLDIVKYVKTISSRKGLILKGFLSTQVF